jgi:hypothetical protein
MKLRPWIRPVAIVTLVCVQPQLARADWIVRLDGTEIHGLVANREHLIANLDAYRLIPILIESAEQGSAKLVRVPRAEVDHLVLENGGATRVFNLLRAQPTTPSDELKASSPRSGGEVAAGLAVAGIVMTVFGASVSLGNETEDGNRYATANYLLMAVGALVTVFGLVKSFGGGSDSSPEESPSGAD